MRMRVVLVVAAAACQTPPPTAPPDDPRVEVLEACLRSLPAEEGDSEEAMRARLAGLESCVRPFAHRPSGRPERIEIPPIVLAPPLPVDGADDIRRRLDAVESRLVRLEARQVPAPKARWTTVLVSTDLPVPIRHNGVTVPEDAKLDVEGQGGLLEIGSGRLGGEDPFAVKLRYEVERGFSVFSIDAQPWAIVRGKDGLGLGKTPLAGVRGAAENVFELASPNREASLRIVVRFGG